MYPQIWPITLISSSYLITDLPCSRSVPPLSCNLSGKQLEAFWGAAPLHFVCAPCLEYMNVNFKLYDPFSLRTIWHVPEGRVCEFHSSACLLVLYDACWLNVTPSLLVGKLINETVNIIHNTCAIFMSRQVKQGRFASDDFYGPATPNRGLLI